MFRFPRLPNMELRYIVRPTDTERVVIQQNGGRHLIAVRPGAARTAERKMGFRPKSAAEWVVRVAWLQSAGTRP